MMKEKNVRILWLNLLLILLSSTSIQAQKSSQINNEFEKIRKNEAALQYFFTRMPKGGDLHNHLTGSVYAETYFNIAVQDSMYLDNNCILYLKNDPQKPDGSIQLKPNMTGLHDYRVRCIDQWSVRNFLTSKSTIPPDEFFFATFGKFSKATDRYLADFLKELRLRAESENVQYLEIMVSSPKVYSDLLKDYKTQNDSLIKFIAQQDEYAFKKTLSYLYQQWDTNHNIQQDINTYVGSLRTLDSLSNATAPSVTTYYQTYAGRNVADPIKVFAQLYVGFKSCQKYDKLVGVNIVQAENGDYALRDYWGHMRMFTQLKVNTKDSIRTSMHAGELCLGLVPPEDLQTHITDAVITAGANRIGHGVDIVFEKLAKTLLSFMAARKTAVEINLTSNEFILGVKGDTHPIMVYYENKVPIVLSTDDPGILRTNLTQQYVVAAMRYPSLKYTDFKEFVYNSIDYSFMPKDEISRVRQTIDSLFVDFEGNIPKQTEQVFGIK